MSVYHQGKAALVAETLRERQRKKRENGKKDIIHLPSPETKTKKRKQISACIIGKNEKRFRAS